MKTFPNNRRKQPSLTYLRRRFEFMRLWKGFIFVAKNTERLKEIMVTADFLSQSVYDTKEKEFERRWEKWSERQDSNL
jgi:hypothetical protein